METKTSVIKELDTNQDTRCIYDIIKKKNSGGDVRDFEKWLGTMRECINSYDYYVNFQKVYENAGRFKVELNLMNSLIGS